jgi:hypothetical protein
MSFSLREALRLTSIETNSTLFMPYLLQTMTHLIQELVDICKAKHVDLSNISAFDLKTTDWHIALIQIYETVYLKDCKNYKFGGQFEEGRRHPPHMPLTMSYVLDEFLTMLHNRRLHHPMNSKQRKEITRDDLHYIKTRLESAQHTV